MASVDIDTEDLAEKVEEFIDSQEGTIHPYQVNSVWMHTHPGNSATPSSTDNSTFRGKKPDLYFVMYILAKGGAQHAELKINGVGTKIYLPCAEPDVRYEPSAGEIKRWAQLYKDNVSKPTLRIVNSYKPQSSTDRRPHQHQSSSYKKTGNISETHRLLYEFAHSDPISQSMILDKIKDNIKEMEYQMYASLGDYYDSI